MKLVVRNLDWYKRRPKSNIPKPLTATVDDLQLVQNHYCLMLAQYDNGEVLELRARVSHNDILNTWTVQGIDHLGHAVLCDIQM